MVLYQASRSFGGDALTATVRTYGELDQAIKQDEIESTEKLCIIEMIVKDPMDASRYMKRCAIIWKSRKCSVLSQ